MIKLGAQPGGKDHKATSHVILLKWLLNLSVMMTVTMRKKIVLKMGAKKDICYAALKDFNFWSKYFLRTSIFFIFHNNLLIISLISSENVINTFKKQCIFSTANVSSVYFVFWYQFVKQMIFLKKWFWVRMVHFKHFVVNICPIRFTSHRTSWQTGKNINFKAWQLFFFIFKWISILQYVIHDSWNTTDICFRDRLGIFVMNWVSILLPCRKGHIRILKV